VDRQQYFDYTQERMIDQNILKQEVVKEIDVTIDNEQGYEPVKLAIGKYVSDTPIGIRHYSDYNSITVMIPQSIKDSVFAEYKDMWDTNLTMYFTSDNPFKAAEEIAEILLEEGLSTSKLSNHAEILANTRNIVTIINVFAYGFIILISLITVANVFNTISTNMELRTREFAMLRSVGMTSKGFRKMVSFESVFYGLKALIYGLPVAVGITYLIYKSMLQGVDVRFYIPATSMCITVIMVFVVVFATMTYSMNKLKKKNILEGLRIEK
jgi:putative ABC transport system permease protein